MTRRALLASPALLVLLAPAGGASPAGSAPGLAVWPARMTLAAGASADVHVANTTRAAAAIDLRAAGLVLDLRGTPHVVPASAGTRLLAVRPSRVVVARGSVTVFTVHAAGLMGRPPGDRPALVLLSARSASGAGVGVRVRIGVAVEVRVPGRVHRRVELGRLRVRGRRLVLRVVNRGDIEERIARGVLLARAWRRGRLAAVLRPLPRDLLPHSRGLVEFAVPRRLHGRLRLQVLAPRLHAGERSFSVSL